MNYPRITIVTPSYNQGDYLEDTISSIIGQDYPNLEYIICDGGSTDNSVEIIKKYQNKLAWWCSENDSGQSNAINKGMKRATGDIVGWINSDDVLLPGALFVIAKFFTDHPDCKFLNGAGLQIDKSGNIQKVTHIVMSKFFAKRGCYNIVQQGMFWKRELFDQIGYLNENFHAKMDVEWLIRAYEANIIIRKIDRPLGAIRAYEGTKTANGGIIWENDANAINHMYNGNYSLNRRKKWFWLFALAKLIKGCYWKNFLMEKKYNGKLYHLFGSK